jgi:GTP-binding protein
MPLPIVAIIGRPNVGKSSLFNRLIGRRVSIVDPTPGVTRDRIEALLEIPADPVREPEGETIHADLCDTGGFGIYTAEGARFDDAGKDLSLLRGDIESQIAAAAERATVVLFTLDAAEGIVPLDREVAALLRRRGLADRVLLVVNKADDESWLQRLGEFGELGFGEPTGVSAKNGFGIRRLQRLLRERLAGHAEAPPASEMRVAIVGRRNAGKSTLVNALAGQPRVIASEIAGTTRDSVDVRIEIKGRTLVAIDTAGVRKRKSWADQIERYSHERSIEAIRRCDVAVLLLESTSPTSQVEKALATEILDRYKPVVIAVNKWDLVERKLSPEDYLAHFEQELPALSYAPLVFISAEKGEGLEDLVAMAFNLHKQSMHREGTGALNAAVTRILENRGPSTRLGTQAKVYYASQIAVQPPTIALVVNKPELFEGPYERYLVNRLRDVLPYSEIPIRLRFSPRSRRDSTGDAPPGRRSSRPAQKRGRGG